MYKYSLLAKFQVNSQNIYRVIETYKNVFLTSALMRLRANCLQHADEDVTKVLSAFFFIGRR